MIKPSSGVSTKDIIMRAATVTKVPSATSAQKGRGLSSSRTTAVRCPDMSMVKRRDSKESS